MYKAVIFYTLLSLVQIVLMSFVAHARSLEVVFNKPGFQGQKESKIESRLIELIDSTVSGGHINISVYRFDSNKIVESLISASKRGVVVKVLMDGGSQKLANDPSHPLHTLAESELLKFCVDKGCRSLHINHNKFALFSNLNSGEKHLVAVTSSNLNVDQQFMHNDLLIVKDDETLYSEFLRYWESISTDKTEFSRFKSVLSKENEIQAYFFPIFWGRDPVLDILKDVDCSIPGSSIKLAHSRFDDSRVEVAKQLKLLQEQGCDLKLILRTERSVRSPGREVINILGRFIALLDYKDKNGEIISKNSIHTKMILIDAGFRGSSTRQKIILTGSQNLNYTSWKLNDEVMLMIRGNDEVFNSYEHFFYDIIQLYQRRLFCINLVGSSYFDFKAICH